MDKGRIKKMQSDIITVVKGTVFNYFRNSPHFLNFSKNHTLNIEMKYKIC